MADELIDICDENNNLLGVQKMKSEAHKDGLWHRSAHVWIYNSKGEILLQLRSKEKHLCPDMWDISVAGHISLGEDPVTSALRETEEEIGLKLKTEDFDFLKIRKFDVIFRDIKNNEFLYIYFYKFDGELEQLKVQKEEIQKIEFFPIDKLENELRTNPSKYTPLGNYWFEILDEVKRKLAF